MPSSGATSQYTWDDFIALEEDDPRELIDGELVEVEVPNKQHERIVAMLCFYLTGWAKAGHGGYAIGSGYKVRISERAGVVPDVQFYVRGNDPGPEEEKGLVHGRPDLVVEILSPSSRRFDRVKKLRYYAERGIPEYWIIDGSERGIERLVLRDGHFTIVDMGADEETFKPASFEGLEIPLADLWS